MPLPGVPFHESWGIIPNDKGRVTEEPDGPVVPGIYAVGWIKRGPSGIIGTNKPDSLETVQMLLEDIPGLTPCVEPSTEAVEKILQEKQVRVVSLEDWRKIDAEEIRRGGLVGKPRERFTRIQEMLDVLN